MTAKEPVIIYRANMILRLFILTWVNTLPSISMILVAVELLFCGDENDSINLTCALNAEIHLLKNIIPIVHDLEKIKLFDLFDFKNTISPSNIFIQEVIAYYNNNLMKKEFPFIQDPTIDENKDPDHSIAIINLFLIIQTGKAVL